MLSETYLYFQSTKTNILTSQRELQSWEGVGGIVDTMRCPQRSRFKFDGSIPCRSCHVPEITACALSWMTSDVRDRWIWAPCTTPYRTASPDAIPPRWPHHAGNAACSNVDMRRVWCIFSFPPTIDTDASETYSSPFHCICPLQYPVNPAQILPLASPNASSTLCEVTRCGICSILTPLRGCEWGN